MASDSNKLSKNLCNAYYDSAFDARATFSMVL